MEPHGITSPPPQSLGDDAFAIDPTGRYVMLTRLEGEATADLYRLELSTGELERLTERRSAIYDVLWIDDRSVWASTNWHPGPGLWQVSAFSGESAPVANTPTELRDLSGGPGAAALVFRWLDSDLDLVRLSLAGAEAPDPVQGSRRVDSKPDISPAGDRLLFESNRGGAYQVWLSNLDGSEARALTDLAGSYTGHPRWASDGQRVVFESRPEGQAEIYVTTVDGGPPTQITRDSAQDVTPNWAHGGDAVYFTSDRSGRWEAWVHILETGEEFAVTSAGGMAPQAGPSGEFLYYAKPFDPGVWRVAVGPDHQTRGAEERIIEELPVGDYDAWTVAGDAVLYLVRDATGGGRMMRLDLATGRSELVAATEATPLYYGGLAASPDGSFALVAHQTRFDNDLSAYRLEAELP